MGNIKFDSGGCCVTIPFRIIRTKGSHKESLACRTSLLKIFPAASELHEWKAGLTKLAFADENPPMTGEICGDRPGDDWDFFHRA